MTPRLEILGFLNQFLQEPPLRAILTFEVECFDRAVLSRQLVKLDLAGQIAVWCRRKSFWQGLLQNRREYLDTRRVAITRPLLYCYLCQALLGHPPNSIHLARLFAGDRPDAVGILVSADPDVMKLREHLATAMMVLELSAEHACLPLIKLSTDNPAEFREAVRRYSEFKDLLPELLVFKHNAP